MVPVLLVIDIFVCSLLSSLSHCRLTTQQQYAAVNYQRMRLISFSMPTKHTHTPMEHLLCLRFLSQCQVLHNNSLSHLCVESRNCCCLLIAFVLFFGYLLPHNNNNICRLRQSCVLSSLLLLSLLLLRHFSHSHTDTQLHSL